MGTEGCGKEKTRVCATRVGHGALDARPQYAFLGAYGTRLQIRQITDIVHTSHTAGA